MTRTIAYTDAIKILGTGQPKELAVAERLLGGAIVGGSVATGGIGFLQLMDARDALLALVEPLFRNLAARVRGASGRTRTELMVAANTVLVIDSFFTAFAQAESALASELKVSFHEQVRLSGGQSDSELSLVESLLTVQPPMPSPARSLEEVRDDLRRYYAGLGHTLSEFIGELAIGERMGAARRAAVSRVLVDELPAAATDGYGESFRRLCLDCPEFELWLAISDREITRDLIRRLAAEAAARDHEMAQALTAIRPERPQGDWPSRIERSNRSRLARPISRQNADQRIPGPVIPSLSEGFVMQSCHVTTVTTSSFDPIERDDWWAGRQRHPSVGLFVRGHLSTLAALESPLVLFGRPGSGKSVLLRWCAADLAHDEFLPILVELRAVPADLDLQSQIEYAMRQQTGLPMTWPELAESTDALPVLLLDGFDELLQATSRTAPSDFLRTVASFQEREADQGRPVATIVTSRTIVAGQATYPPDTVAVRLDPFDYQQVGAWLRRWNDANESYFRSVGREPLSRDEVMVHAELATEPLLLQMLALYDAGTGALPRRSEDLDAIELYERLLRLFVDREILRGPAAESAPGRPIADADPERELDRLAVASFAMFNRHRQHAGEIEITQDLKAVLGPQAYSVTSATEDGDSATPGQLILGRFFFVHESQALQQDSGTRSYEFLHATFGEYLIARYVVKLLTSARADDLWDLLAWTPLTDRVQIVGYVQELLAKRPAAANAAYELARGGLSWTPSRKSGLPAWGARRRRPGGRRVGECTPVVPV